MLFILCSFNPNDLVLNGDVSYGAQEFFENEALMAVRLANFLSAFMQIVDPDEVFPGGWLSFQGFMKDLLN